MSKKYNSTTRICKTKKYKTPDELAEAINEYFEECSRVEYNYDDEGNIQMYKGQPVCLKAEEPPTTTGLALAIGFKSRQSLVDYVKSDKVNQENDLKSIAIPEYENEGFREVIVKAYAICEDYMEKRLYDKEGSTGAKFALSNCDKRWSDTKSLDLSLKKPDDVVSADEAVRRLEALGFVKKTKKQMKDEGTNDNANKNKGLNIGKTEEEDE